MTVGFPPVPVYPLAIDDDSTLYLVYNTTESIITDDNQPWSEEIPVKPRTADQPEIWADNGFANISGELLYYDAVEKNGDDRVVMLKRCARNLGGEHTQYNVAGTDIRSFVVAEHHDQLAEAIENVETFLLDLDDRIKEVADQSDCFDDGNCPSVNFNFDVTSNDPCVGTTINYQLDVIGNFNTFKLDFGDGTSTTSTQNGTHTYAPNAIVDPVVSIANSFCQLVVTGVNRTQDKQPNVTVTPVPLRIPIPGLPLIPSITIPSVVVPPVDITIPPIVLPCLDVAPTSGISISIGDIQIPSVISFTPVDLPSTISIIAPSFTPISITPVNIPSVISITPPTISLIGGNLPSTISILGSIPSMITITPPIMPSTITITPVMIPSTISIVGTIPTTITLTGSVPTTITLIENLPRNITVTDNLPNTIFVLDNLPRFITVIPPYIPAISVNWGTPPAITVTVNCNCCSGVPFPTMTASDQDTVNADYSFVGLPSTIEMMVPEIPAVSLDASAMPSRIAVDVIGMDIPKEIRFANLEAIPTQISVVATDLPPLRIDASNLPSAIKLDASSLTSQITVVGDFPSVISIDASGIPSSIKVEGFPDSIRVEGFPDFIPVSITNPEIEMVYKGAPIDVVVKLEMQDFVGKNDDGSPCFRFVPCSG